MRASGAQREQPLLDGFEFARVEFEVARGGFEHRQCLVGLVGGAFGGDQRLVEQPLGAVARAFQTPRRASQRRLRPGGAGKFGNRLVQGFSEPLGVLQQRAARGEPILFAGFGRQGVELGQVVAQKVLFLAAGGGAARPFLLALPRCAPIAPGRGQCGHVARVLGEGVEGHAVVGGIEQAALLELALDLDQAVAELAQQADACRLVVDKGPAAPVAAQQPAQHDRIAVAVEPGLAQDRICRVIAPDREFGGDRRLAGAVAHEPGFTAFPQRQPQRIEQDRLPRPGLAGQHAQPRSKRQIEPVDQDNLAYGQPQQHSPDNIGASEGKPAPAIPPQTG